ncbi:MAG: hypothetical protein H0X36_07840 [Sphingomonadaceae bacterium]|nr:hypothetical protein [Sphingomonadaceae bacterium]
MIKIALATTAVCFAGVAVAQMSNGSMSSTTTATSTRAVSHTTSPARPMVHRPVRRVVRHKRAHKAVVRQMSTTTATTKTEAHDH